jgi:hypothetical protein
VGYVVTSLRDFEQHKSRAPCVNSGRNFLRDTLLVCVSHKNSLEIPGRFYRKKLQRRSGGVQ